jgi:hypothetical protein
MSAGPEQVFPGGKPQRYHRTWEDTPTSNNGRDGGMLKKLDWYNARQTTGGCYSIANSRFVGGGKWSPTRDSRESRSLVKRCFNQKIEPVFSVGTAGPERSPYGPNMARRGLERRLFYRHCIAQSFSFQLWARHYPVGTSLFIERTLLYNIYMGFWFE